MSTSDLFNYSSMWLDERESKGVRGVPFVFLCHPRKRSLDASPLVRKGQDGRDARPEGMGVFEARDNEARR